MVWLLGEVKRHLFYCIQSRCNEGGVMIVDGHSFGISMHTHTHTLPVSGARLYIIFYSLIYFFLGINATKLLGNTLLQGK